MIVDDFTENSLNAPSSSIINSFDMSLYQSIALVPPPPPTAAPGAEKPSSHGTASFDYRAEGITSLAKSEEISDIIIINRKVTSNSNDSSEI